MIRPKEIWNIILKDKIKMWLHSLYTNSIVKWNEMQKEFLKKFYFSYRTNYMRKQIATYRQKENEHSFECWDRFKVLLLSCPQHGFEICRL